MVWDLWGCQVHTFMKETYAIVLDGQTLTSAKSAIVSDSVAWNYVKTRSKTRRESRDGGAAWSTTGTSNGDQETLRYRIAWVVGARWRVESRIGRVRTSQARRVSCTVHYVLHARTTRIRHFPHYM